VEAEVGRECRSRGRAAGEHRDGGTGSSLPHPQGHLGASEMQLGSNELGLQAAQWCLVPAK
jgi:hypothetical protein